MTDKHTPGPWAIGVVEEDDASWFEVRGPSDDNGWATVVAGEVDNPANARLIAAAPDLLRLVDLVHGSFGGGLVVTFSEADAAEFAEVLAKARGAL